LFATKEFCITGFFLAGEKKVKEETTHLVFSVDLVSGVGFLIGAHVDDGTQHFDARQPEKVIAMLERPGFQTTIPKIGNRDPENIQ